MQDKLDKVLAELSSLRQENATLREALVKDGKLPEYSKVAKKSLPPAKEKTVEIQSKPAVQKPAAENASNSIPEAKAKVAQNKALAELKFVPKAQFSKAKAKVTAVYFEGIKQGKLGFVRGKLKEAEIPTHKILSITFIGKKITEFLILNSTLSLVCGKLEKAGFKKVNFDPLKPPPSIKGKETPQIMEKQRDLAAEKFTARINATMQRVPQGPLRNGIAAIRDTMLKPYLEAKEGWTQVQHRHKGARGNGAKLPTNSSQ
jgi:hypothetical protein